MYFVDALYGRINLDISNELVATPELQRLREVRLCNINSPFITGGTSLNRFEHAIGTAYLAQEIIKHHTSNSDERDAFIIASLLHDIVTASFGHSLEYLFETTAKTTYEHANIWRMVFSGKTIPSSRYFFCNRKSALHTLFNQNKLELLQDLLESNHHLSKLLASEIDIDNIDNVFRFAFHVGISFDPKTPLQLAKALHYDGNTLLVDSGSLTLFNEWFDIRKKLYKYLLEDGGEFTAKALLERCFIECTKEEKLSVYDWVLTDSEMATYIINNGNKIAKSCMQRLMLMDFPKHKKIYYTNDYKKIDSFLSKKKLDVIEKAFQRNVFLHFIRDVNKTNRTLKLRLEDGTDITIGKRDDRYLIGLFANNLTHIEGFIPYLEDILNTKLIKLKGNFVDEKQSTLF